MSKPAPAWAGSVTPRSGASARPRGELPSRVRSSPSGCLATGPAGRLAHHGTARTRDGLRTADEDCPLSGRCKHRLGPAKRQDGTIVAIYRSWVRFLILSC